MSKTIEEQVEETVIDLTQHIQSIDGVALDELIDNIRTALQERDRIAREQAINECEKRVKREFNGYGGVLGFTQTGILELLPKPNITSNK